MRSPAFVQPDMIGLCGHAFQPGRYGLIARKLESAFIRTMSVTVEGDISQAIGRSPDPSFPRKMRRHHSERGRNSGHPYAVKDEHSVAPKKKGGEGLPRAAPEKFLQL